MRNVAFGRRDTQSALNLTVSAIKRKVSFSDVTRGFYGTIQARKRGLLGLITALTQLIDARAPFLRLMAIRQDRSQLTSLLFLNCFLPLFIGFANNGLLYVNMWPLHFLARSSIRSIRLQLRKGVLSVLFSDRF